MTLTENRRAQGTGEVVIATGSVYVLAWLVGLVLAPTAPEPGAAALEVHAYYAENAGAVVASSALVHGVAGLALVALALGIALATGVGGSLRSAVVGLGAAAAGLSLVQLLLALVAAGGTAVETSGALFSAVNLVDVGKILCLAGFAVAGTAAMREAGCAPRWLLGLTGLLVPLLVVGSAAFLVSSDVLMLVLAASLLTLLAWVASVAAVVGLRAR